MQEVFVDSLLWYVHTQRNVANEAALAQNVLNFYDEGEIKQSQETLWKAVRPQIRVPRRQGDK